MIACVSRIAVRGHGRERTLDPVRLLRIVRAFQGYERADLREMTLEALPVTPEMCADAAWLARERFAEINTRTFAAHYALMRERRRLREAGIEVDLYAPTNLPIHISDIAIAMAVASLADETKRRSDRRAGIASLLPRDTD